MTAAFLSANVAVFLNHTDAHRHFFAFRVWRRLHTVYSDRCSVERVHWKFGPLALFVLAERPLRPGASDEFLPRGEEKHEARRARILHFMRRKALCSVILRNTPGSHDGICVLMRRAEFVDVVQSVYRDCVVQRFADLSANPLFLRDRPEHLEVLVRLNFAHARRDKETLLRAQSAQRTVLAAALANEPYLAQLDSELCAEKVRATCEKIAPRVPEATFFVTGSVEGSAALRSAATALDSSAVAKSFAPPSAPAPPNNVAAEAADDTCGDNTVDAERAAAIADNNREQRRTGLAPHAFSDRVRVYFDDGGAGARAQLVERCARFFAVCSAIADRMTDNSFGSRWHASDAWHLFNVMQVLHDGEHSLPRTSRDTRFGDASRECSVDLSDRGIQLAAELAQSGALSNGAWTTSVVVDVLATALYHSRDVYTQVETLFGGATPRIRLPLLLERKQVRLTALTRTMRTELRSVAVCSPAAFDMFCTARCLQFVRERVARTRALLASDDDDDDDSDTSSSSSSSEERATVSGDAGADDCESALPPLTDNALAYIAIPLFSNGAQFADSTPRFGRKNYAVQWQSDARPLAIISSVRRWLPELRDGVDFFVAWSPHLYGDSRVAASDEWKELLGAEVSGAKRKHASSATTDNGAASAQEAGRSPTLALERNVYVALPNSALRDLQAIGAACALQQRCAGRWAGGGRPNYDAALCSPMVARTLACADQFALGAVCASLNALSALLGGSVHEWRSDSVRGVRDARRVARCCADIGELMCINVYNEALQTNAQTAVFGPLEDALLYSHVIYTQKYSKKPREVWVDMRRKDKAQPIASMGAYDAFAVLLHGDSLPVVMERELCEPLAALFDETPGVSSRVAEHLRDALREDEEENFCDGKVRAERLVPPAWYTLLRDKNFLRRESRHAARKERPAPSVRAKLARQRFDAKKDAECEKFVEMAAAAERDHEPLDALPDFLLTREQRNVKSAYDCERVPSRGATGAPLSADAVDDETLRAAQELAMRGATRAVCECGGATLEECGFMRVLALESEEPRCCLCALDSVPQVAISDNPIHEGMMAGVCAHCSPRVPWRDPARPDSQDWLHAARHVRVHEPRNKRSVGAVALMEALIATARYWRVQAREREDADEKVWLALDGLFGVRHRLRHWISKTRAPFNIGNEPSDVTPRYFALMRSMGETSKRLQTLADEDLHDSMRAARHSARYYDECLNFQMRAPLQRTEALRVREQRSYNIVGAMSADERVRTAGLALFTQQLELMHCTEPHGLLNEYRRQLPRDAELSMRTLFVEYTMPLDSIAAVMDYLAASDVDVVFPLAPCPLADSTQFGEPGLPSIIGDKGRVPRDRLLHALLGNGDPRPLTCFPPCTAEALFDNWY